MSVLQVLTISFQGFGKLGMHEGDHFTNIPFDTFPCMQIAVPSSFDVRFVNALLQNGNGIFGKIGHVGYRLMNVEDFKRIDIDAHIAVEDETVEIAEKEDFRLHLFLAEFFYRDV